MSTKAEYAISLHDKGYNCAQAVACTFCKEFGVDEQEMFRIAEGFGLGKERHADEGKHLQAGEGAGTEIQRKKRFLPVPRVKGC